MYKNVWIYFEVEGSRLKIPAETKSWCQRLLAKINNEKMRKNMKLCTHLKKKVLKRKNALKRSKLLSETFQSRYFLYAQ